MTDNQPQVPGFAGALRVLLATLEPHRRRQLGWLTALTVISGGADLLVVGSAMNFLLAIAGDPKAWIDPVPEAALLFAGGTLIANLIRLLYLRQSERYVCGAIHELTVEMQRRVFAQPYDYHVRHHSSELISALQKVEILAMTLFHQWLQSAAALASGIAVVALVMSVDPVPALLTLVGLAILYLAIARISAARLAANAAVVGEVFDQRVRKVQDSLGAIRDLKIDHSERAQLEDFRQVDARYAAAQASTGFVAAAPRYLIEAGAVLLVAGLAILLSGRGAGSLALIGGVALGGLRVLPLLQTAYRNWAIVKANRAILDDVMDLMRLQVPDETQSDGPALPFRRSLGLRNVSFRYPARAEPALQDVSLAIERGSRTGLAGETGSGKSTLTDLIMGLLQPQSGTIEIDGQPLDQSRVRAWQRNIAHVSQSIFLADASIARNIAFSVPGAAFDMERVRSAATRAGIADFVDTLPDGYETMVGEHGVRLSGGQRQRIAIARALFKDAPFLILDEATNALDEETEAKVLASLFAEKERTILIVTHRPSALSLCDQVVELKDGRIASR